MDETDVFVQIYIFYPTFGQKQRDFCPNLHFSAHIWIKIVIIFIPKEKKRPRPSVMRASVVCLCSFSFFCPYPTSLQQTNFLNGFIVVILLMLLFWFLISVANLHKIFNCSKRINEINIKIIDGRTLDSSHHATSLVS